MAGCNVKFKVTTRSKKLKFSREKEVRSEEVFSAEFAARDDYEGFWIKKKGVSLRIRLAPK